MPLIIVPAEISHFIAFLHNSIFPPLLNEAEEAEALLRLSQGEADARNMLIERNLRLVAHICKKFESSGVDREDLISIGTIGLIKGISSFSPDKGARLATYASRCIENEILMYLRSIRNQKTEISLSDPVGYDKEGNELTLIDLLGSEESSAQERVELDEERRSLREHLYVLDEKERLVLSLRYGLPNGNRVTQREIAQKLGISRSYISRIEKRAIDKLKKAVFRESI
ncbi:MAG: RNA polymerase sporulation sigma factor SigK [Bacillota bacterium]|nr:RNA polymerase sporulation sigma factor SigK [Bacillota bacterium]